MKSAKNKEQLKHEIKFPSADKLAGPTSHKVLL